jgi:hypothetical protein
MPCFVWLESADRHGFLKEIEPPALLGAKGAGATEGLFLFDSIYYRIFILVNGIQDYIIQS